MVNRHSPEVLIKLCLLSICKPRHILHRLLANNKKNKQNISKLISFKDEAEACGNKLLFFAGISPVFLFSCGLVLTALVCSLW